MNILITGGWGFIGSNFINYIFNKIQNINIINIDALYYCANEENINKEIRYNKNYKFIKGNIGNEDLINNILFSNNVNIVVNFAAQSHVCNSFSNPIQYTKDNVLGTHTLLDCCYNYNIKTNNIKKFIHISRDEVYGESELNENKKIEQSVLCPTNPYAATKAGAELIVKSYYHSFKFPIIITRSNNIYGPNQYPEKVIPKFIKLLKEDKKITIHGNGDNLRSFLHSEDVSDAFYLILIKGVIGEIYNIGSDKEYKILDVAKMLIQKIKNSEDYDKYLEYVEDRPFNDKRYYISNQKVIDLGWVINKQFSESINELI